MKIIKEVTKGNVLDSKDLSKFHGGTQANINDAEECYCVGSNKWFFCNNNTNKEIQCRCSGSDSDNTNFEIACVCK